MAYDETLEERILAVLLEAGAKDGVTTRKMFGGLALMLRGHMFAGVINDDLLVRVGPDATEEALAEPHARPMDFTGRPLNGFVFVGPEGHREDGDLARWVGRGLDFVRGLPPKGA